MAAATLADYFDGKVEQREYTQVFDFEVTWSYVYSTDSKTGVKTVLSASMNRALVTAEVCEQVFRFEGAPYALAHSTASLTVTDIGGASYTFAPVRSFTDGSSGTRVMERESVQVGRARISPHMWSVEVVRRGTRYKVNNKVIVAGPDWMN